ncbi:MAG: B12-binding domain-containing radical SAM protein, partial [Gemmatimonadetes bacterium]|nr:B12-binding domain-containing radical SAM protein [Gemmatimonadota bacterium]
MRVHLVNPSDLSFGVGVITPRWLFVLAGATPESFGDPTIVDETLEPFDPDSIEPGDIVGIGIHTFNSLRGYEVGRLARERGATVVFGGVHASLFPDEAYEYGAADAVVKGDGDVVWPEVLADVTNGGPRELYEGGRIEAEEFVQARWDLMPPDRYMWGSVQTVRGCPKHCSFCSVWRMDGQRPRQRTVDLVLEEIVELRRRGYRFIALADDNFYPVTLRDLEVADKRENKARLHELQAIRAERFELMERLAELPDDLVFFTQITMEVADDPEFMDAMREAGIRGALVGVETVTEEGLKAIYKNFNSAGSNLVEVLRTFRRHGLHILGSFIFGLPTDRPDTFDATVELAEEADIAFAQFVMLSPFPGTLDFLEWEKQMADDPTRIDGHPLTRYWLIPQLKRPKLYIPHPTMSPQEIRERTQDVWDRFYSLRSIWKRASVTPNLRTRLAFVLMSKQIG